MTSFRTPVKKMLYECEWDGVYDRLEIVELTEGKERKRMQERHLSPSIIYGSNLILLLMRCTNVIDEVLHVS